MAWIDDKIFRFKGNDLLVMIYFVTHMSDDGICSFGVRTLAAEVGINYQAARESIKRLCQQGITTQFATHPTTSVTVSNYESYTKPTKGKQRSLQRTQPQPKKTLEERRTDFGMTLKPYTQDFGGEYSRAMINDFYRYWSEPNQAQTKMRWEMEKTWSLAGRLATWANNNRFKNNKNNNYGRETATDKLRRTFDEANEFRNRLAAEREANLERGDNL